LLPQEVRGPKHQQLQWKKKQALGALYAM